MIRRTFALAWMAGWATLIGAAIYGYLTRPIFVFALEAIAFGAPAIAFLLVTGQWIAGER
jgi:hypothetical protein